MPISSNDFEKSERESGLLLLDFLRSNPRIAYSVDDLVETLASMDRNETKKEVEKMLTLMDYGRRVKSRKIAGVTYYRYNEFFGYSPPGKV